MVIPVKINSIAHDAKRVKVCRHWKRQEKSKEMIFSIWFWCRISDRTLSYIKSKIVFNFLFFTTWNSIDSVFLFDLDTEEKMIFVHAKELLAFNFRPENKPDARFVWIKYSITNFTRPVYDVWNTCWNFVFQ